MTNKRPPTETRIAREIERVLLDRLPSTWTVQTRPTKNALTALTVEVGPQPDRLASLAVTIKRTIEPRSIPDIARQALANVEDTDTTPTIAAGYLSPRSRRILQDHGVSYIDTTGNIRIDTQAAGLFIQNQGTDKDPWPQDRNLLSLRGRGAARALRAIIDTAPPFGVRELAANTGASPATVSRVLGLLEFEGLLNRQPRGPVISVNWQEVIRRWAQDYDQTTSNTAATFLAPRGIPFLERKLRSTKLNYAATGAFAAQRFNPIAPVRTATIYTDDVIGLAEHLDLRETDLGPNVVLLEPFDPVVFDRMIDRDGLRCAAPSQLAVDLLTGPGREPSQGEEILKWMKDNQHVWRT